MNAEGKPLTCCGKLFSEVAVTQTQNCLRAKLFFSFFAKFEKLLGGIFRMPSSQEQERWIYLSLPWRHKDAGARKKYLLRVRTEWVFFFQGRKGSSREVTIKYLNDEIKAVNIIKKAVNMSEWYSSYKPVGRWKPAQIFLFFYFFCTGAE